MRRSTRIPFLLLMLLIGVGLFETARAACSSFQPLPEFYVGDTNASSPEYDAACTHNDIQSAIDAATCIYGTKIFITREHTYTNQGIGINDKNVTLIGRGDGIGCGPVTIGICDPVIGCPPPPTSPLVTISGKSGASVLAIGGNSKVYLQYLDINNGNNAAGNGGGIGFEGTGTLTLDTSWVRANQANLGAGIYFGGVSGPTISELKLLSHTQILANTAGASGGGIAVAGNATLTITEPSILIQGNHADNGYGGGVDVIGPAQADIGSPAQVSGSTVTGVIDSNVAAYGGGLALIASHSDFESAQAFLFTTDAARPIGITNNIATHTGGGIFLLPFSDGTLPDAGNAAEVSGWDYCIDNNIAAEGAAIYADVSSSIINQSLAGQVWLGNPHSAGAGYPVSLGAVPCTDSSLCNTIDHNETADPGSGSIILIQDTGYLIANRFAMRGNHADHAIRIVGDQVVTDLYDCLIAGNSVAHELIYESGNNTPTIIDSCTFANDSIGATHAIHTESDLTLNDSIVAEPGTLTLDYSGNPANLVVDYVLSNDISTLPASGTGIIPGTPEFVDLAGGDYHLKPTSLGVDFAPTTSSYYVQNSADLDGNPRNFDLPAEPNVFGTQDIGAYEMRNLFRECGAADSLYCDGFDH